MQPDSKTRRRILKAGAAAPLVLGAPWIARYAHAQADLGAYQGAKINWRQAEGEKLNGLTLSIAAEGGR